MNGEYILTYRYILMFIANEVHEWLFVWINDI